MIHNHISEEKLQELIKSNKCPISHFIEINKYWSSKEAMARGKETEWVVSKEVAHYIPTLIKRIEELKNNK